MKSVSSSFTCVECSDDLLGFPHGKRHGDAAAQNEPGAFAAQSSPRFGCFEAYSVKRIRTVSLVFALRQSGPAPNVSIAPILELESLACSRIFYRPIGHLDILC